MESKQKNQERQGNSQAQGQRIIESLLEPEVETTQSRQPSKTSPFWLTHHWPDKYSERCIVVGRWHVCRRCLALHPLSLVVAIGFVMNIKLWPESLDPGLIWLLSIPATVAFSGEAIRMFRYSANWQLGTTLLAALAFGRALGYELETRWHPYFWGPIAFFGGIWFFASWHGHRLNQLDQKLNQPD